MYHDVESQLLYSESQLSLASGQVRAMFVKKVYALLAVQLFVTMLVASPFVLMDHRKTELFIATNQWLFWLSIIGSMTILIVFACAPSLMCQVPLNYTLLALFTLFEGLSLGIVSSMYTTASIVQTIGFVSAVVIVLSVFATNTKKDFTKSLWPYLLAASVVMIGAGLILILFPTHIGTTIYAALGALLFSMYLVFDTQMIMGGKTAMQFGIDDYVPAAIALYVDIISLFIYLLQLFGERRD